MKLKDKFKLGTQAERDAEYQKKQEEKMRQHWLSVETNRKEQEQYAMKEISGWMFVGPFMGLVVSAIAGIMILLSGESDVVGLWWIVGIGLAPLMLFGIISNIDDQWKASIAAKGELERKGATNTNSEVRDFVEDYGSNSSSDTSSTEMSANGFTYKYGYVYTDSFLSCWSYQLSKFVMGLSTIVFSILVAILLFMWLGSISIAPTTIIIILLILILLK